MSQTNVVKNSTNPDQIYFDLTVTNFESTTTVPPIFSFNESRTMPFIEKPEDYWLSVVRFTVESTTIPTQIVSIQPSPNSDVDATIYSVSLAYDGVVVQKYISWIPQDAAAAVPPPPSANPNGLQVNTTGYYNAYSYTWFVDLVNTAFQDAFNDLAVAKPAIAGSHAPFLLWDTSTSTATLYADFDFYNDTTSPYIVIYMNAPLFTLFNSFPAKYLGYTGVGNGMNFQLLIRNSNYANLRTITLTPPGVTPVVSYRAMVLYQECTTTANWTPVTAIVFTSGTLPVVPEQVSTPVLLNNGSNLFAGYGGNNAAIANVITDLVLQSGDYRSNFVYVPSAEYRLITLRGNQPLKNIDIEIYYRVKSGELIPFRIGSGQSVTLKLAFLKKSSIQLAQELNPLLPTMTIKPTTTTIANNGGTPNNLAPTFQYSF